MQLLSFEIGGERYGLDFSLIAEVIPLVEMRKLPHVPEYISGVFSYRGVITPAVDICVLFTGKEAQKLLSTRIIIINYKNPADISGQSHFLGLIAERVTETVVYSITEMQQSGITNNETQYLGEIISAGSGTLQRIIPEKI